jgi:hypothetical protein
MSHLDVAHFYQQSFRNIFFGSSVELLTACVQSGITLFSVLV